MTEPTNPSDLPPTEPDDDAPPDAGGTAQAPGAADGPQEAGDAVTGAGGVPPGPDTRVLELERQVSEWQDRHLRLAAEYDNFRKRTARERDELRGRAQADLAQRLLEALDDLGRVAHLDPEATAAPDVIQGVELVERKLLRELGAAGLEVVNATDVPFDPGVHEAIATVAAATAEEDHTVAAVFQVGYRFNGTLLRPARVQVRVFAPAD